MNVGREIASRLAEFEVNELEGELDARYRKAIEIMQTIPSGTTDENLTPVQRTAVDEYEVILAFRAALREGS